MIKKRRNEKLSFYAIALMLMILLASIFSVFPFFASAEEVEYTSVIADLEKDDSFSIENYPLAENDYSLQVIQVAENKDNRLFVYIYQPSADIEKKATSINISTDKNNLDYHNYTLTLVSEEQTLFKYLVNDFTLTDDDLRVYDVTTIYREFNENIDEGLPENNNNTIDEVSYKVAKIWTAQTYKNEVLYTCMDSEVIEIVDKYVGFVRYFGGNSYLFCLDSCDSHFVAFNTDKNIENLLEADVYFQTQKVYYENGLSGVDSWDFSEVKDNYSYITEYDTAFYESPNSAWQGYSYSWSRIQTVDEFFATNEFNTIYKGALFNQKLEYTMDEEAKSCMENMQWVLRFYESSYEKTNAPYSTKNYTIVSNVSVLRLKFESEGVVYNLGTIDNKQSGSEASSNNMNSFLSLSWWMWLLIGIVIISLFSVIFPSILNIIVTLLKYIFKGLWWVITAPLSLFKKEKK